eukprot:691328_1
MGNVLSKEQQLSDESSAILQKLVSLGFDSSVSFKSVTYYGPNIRECIDFVLKQHMNGNATKRVDCLLALQRLKNEQHISYDIYELITKVYASSNKGGIQDFIRDCGQYAMSIDMDNIHKCDMATCEYIKREYRNKNIYDKNTKKRFKMYGHCKSEQSVVIQQFLDQIHINKCHLSDIGLRYDAHSDTKDNTADMYRQVISKRKRFNKLRNDHVNTSKSNKFVTQVLVEDCNYTPYSFGVRFYYHKYYANNKSKGEILPGTTAAMESGNMHISNSYSYSSWFVAPKRKTMKDEVLNGPNHSLTIIEYENTVIKARMKHKAMSRFIKGAVKLWEIVYRIQAGTMITMKHILAVLLYTNHTDLSAAFSRSFRKLSGAESDGKLKQRHSHYANWARLLREAVECWGYGLGETTETRSIFYHGISKKMVFDGFQQRFSCPTSTTLQYETAVMFANQGEGDEEGIVISIKNNGMAASFFDCIRWSDFAGESEMLFLGGYEPLEICGLTVIGNEVNVSYDEWIQSIKVFQTGMIEGRTSTDKVTPSNAEQIDLLVGNVLNKRKALDIIPQYIQTLFENVLHKTTWIGIDIGRLNKEICFVYYDRRVDYGYYLLKHLYFDDKNEIKWNVWRQLYPGLERIDIHSVVKIPSEENGVQFEYRESIFVDDVLMLGILSFLKQTKIKKIEIFYPSNSMDSLNKLVKTYCGSFEEIDYRLDVDDTYCHEDWGSCTVFTCLLF